MFEFIRNNTRVVLGFMLLLIIPSFVFFGIEGYSRSNTGASTTVAEVGGYKITRAEWDNAHQRVLQNARQQMSGADIAKLDTPALRLATLDNLVRERLLLVAASDMHLSPSDARLQRLFATDPQFAQLRNPDGSVNREILAMQGMSSEMFAQRLRQEVATQQVLAGASRAVLAPASIVDATVDPLLQRREVQFKRFEAPAYRDKVKPTDAEIEAFYKAHTDDFKAPEMAEIEYVQLDFDTVGAASVPTEDELRKFYDANAARFTAPEERQARHILINADKSLAASERAAAKAKAETLLAQARSNPAGFAELAKKNSQDTGSAVQGGDLGFFGRGAMVKPFEDAAFGMKTGDITGPVETDYGYHIIQLVGTKGGEVKPFADVKAEITAELRRTAAQKLWPAQAELFTNTVYEQSDSLQPAIDKFKLKKQTATVQRTPAAGATGPLASAKLLEAVFAKDALENKRNTDAVEVGPNQLVSAHVLKHTPARVQTLDEVKAAVVERLVTEQALALAKKEGQAALAALGSGSGDNKLSDNAIISRSNPQGVPRPVLEAALRADAGKLPVNTGVELPGAGYVVLRVLKVLPREKPPGSEETISQQYAQAWAAAESDAFMTALKKRYKARVLPEAQAASTTPASGF